MRISLFILCLLLVAPRAAALPEAAGDDPHRALEQAYALRSQPEHRFEALDLALTTQHGFRQRHDLEGEGEADFLIGLLLEDRALASWYETQNPSSRIGLDPAIDFFARADAIFLKTGDWVGGVKVAYEMGNTQLLLGDTVQACGFYREGLNRYAIGQAAHAGVEITLLAPDRRDFRTVLQDAVNRACL